MIKCTIEIKDNSTGEIREYLDTLRIREDGNPNVFIWKEGNYSCDCNRRIFFKRINNEETEEDFNIECSIGNFSANIKDSISGEVYYKEF